MKKKLGWWGVIWIVVIFALFRWPYINLPLERDEGAYAYEGWIWITGRGLPYRDIYEMKPPLLNLVYGIAIGLGGNTLAAIRIFAAVYTAAVVVMFALIVRKWWGDQVMWAAGIMMALLMNSFWWGTVQFNAESLILLPLLGAVWFMSKSFEDGKPRGWQAGLCLGLGIWIKQVGIYPAIIWGMYYWWRGKSRKLFWQLILGGVLPAVVFGAYFWYWGALGDLWENIVVFAARSTADGFNPQYLCQAASWSGGCLTEWLIRMPYFSGTLFGLGIAGFAAAAKKRGRPWEMGVMWVATMWLVIKGAGWKDWNHYYLLLIPGLLWGAIYLEKAAEKYSKWLMYFLAGLLVLGTVGLEWSFIAQGTRVVLAAEYGTENERLFIEAVKVAEWVKNNVDAKDKLIVWNDEAEVYFYAGKISGSKWLYYYPPMLPTMTDYKNKLTAEELTPWPKWMILDKSNTWGELDWIKSKIPDGSYRKVEEIGEYSIMERIN